MSPGAQIAIQATGGASMRLFLAICLAVALVSTANAQVPTSPTIDIRGDNLPDMDKLSTIWIYPEDYEGKTIRLSKMLFEVENFEFHPQVKGFLFSFEPVILERKAFHPHIGNCNFLSHVKLNFYCSAAQGEQIRQMFKGRQDAFGMPTEVMLKVEKRDNVFLGVLVSFTPRNEGN
jgi:hypothetical protein